jgi:hypothetical protein
MQAHQLLWVVVLIAAGYVLGRYYPAPGQMVGLR